MGNQCKICKCISSDLIDGRCPGCAAAKEAADKGISYGKLQGQKHQAEQAYLAAQKKLYDEYQQKKEPNICTNCGKEVPHGKPFGNFCTEECREEWEKKERDALSRGAILAPANNKKKYNCVYCGKPLSGKRRLYCDDQCKYLHNQEQIKKRSAERADAGREEDQKRCNLTCTICGEPITEPNMRLYCSKECATIGRRRRVAENKEKKKMQTAEAAKQKAIEDFEQGV